MPATKPKRYTMADIRSANAAAGQHFFDRETMRHFASRIAGGPYCGPHGVFFVTSELDMEKTAGSERYTVREFLPESAKVKNLTEFRGLRHLDDARQTARDAAHDR